MNIKMNNKNLSSVLEKCGITVEIIKSLKKKGLVIPKKIRPTKRPLKSPSEEWFYSVADRFTPPLTSAEKQVFLTSPHLLTLQILKAVDLLFEVSVVLYEALEKIKTNLKRDEEKVAAVLSVLKIFHGCLDNNYLKYDRHLEYHEYKESPVGFYWQKLKKLVLKAAKNTKLDNPKDWADKKVLEVISVPRRLLITTEYAICCKDVYEQLKDLQAQNRPVEIILKNTKKLRPKLFEIIKKYSEHFYCSPEKFVEDVLATKDTNLYEKLIKSKEVSSKAVDNIKSKLSKSEANEFERVIEIVDDFIATQELEGLIAYGVKPNIKNHLFETLAETYDQLCNLFNKNINLVQPNYRKKIQEIFRAEDMPSKFVALRKIISEMEFIFDKRIKKLYFKELRRWKIISK